MLTPDGRQLISGGGYHFKGGEITDGEYALHEWRLPESVWPSKTVALSAQPAAEEALSAAIVAYSFEKDDFFSTPLKPKALTYIRDLSGHDRHAIMGTDDIDQRHTADGRVGGALQCTGKALHLPQFIGGRKEFTFTMWVHLDGKLPEEDDRRTLAALVSSGDANYSKSGNWSRDNNSRMDRALPGSRSMKPQLSSVTTI